ncbi:MAG: cyanophycinase [Planctomycetes bacterium]|nr:cyanophycinase [Planctomycetota bacterium]
MWSMLVAAALMGDPGSNAVKGRLVVVGGGTTLNAVVDRSLEMAGGKAAKVAIIAEANPENGPGSLAQWKRTDAAKVSLINPRQPTEAVRLIRDSNLIWMPGGLQGVFMNSIQGTGIAEAVRDRYRAGAIVGGTSAGAAVMSKTMIGGRSDLDSLRAGSTPFLMDGLGLWPEVIVDQHFLQKGRFNRLALAVLDHPKLVGIGIDEETAVIVQGDEFEVLGNGNVTVVDARKANHEKLVKGEPAAVRNMTIHVLRSGMKYRLDE